VLRIRTLGGLFAADEAGEPIGGAASQRRLLALLAVLAVAGDAGLSRDKLIAILWPDSEEERARHSLTQGLYAARRALGADDLFVAGGDVRLNRERVASDVQEFEAALEADDLVRALAVYQGPFLDGFYLPGSTEFEQWSSAHRQRLEDRAVGALERLARGAEEAGELREALDWRRRLAAVRPLDASVAVSLMQVLAQSGDRAGALQHARLHETLLRDQLGLAADPVVSALAERLREPVEWQAEVATATLVPSAPLDELEEPPPIDERRAPPVRYVGGRTVTLGEDPVRVVPPPGPGRAGWRWLTWLVAASLALAAGIWAWRREPAPVAAPAPAPLAQRIVVAPFRVSGASASLAYLRDGLVELLSTRLADDSASRSVDAGAVLAAWRGAGLGRSVDVSRDTVVALARRLGAERVVLGSVVGTPSRVVLSADVVGVPGGAPLARAAVEGPADSLSALVDRLAARLLVAGAGEEASLAAQTSGVAAGAARVPRRAGRLPARQSGGGRATLRRGAGARLGVRAGGAAARAHGRPAAPPAGAGAGAGRRLARSRRARRAGAGAARRDGGAALSGTVAWSTSSWRPGSGWSTCRPTARSRGTSWPRAWRARGPWRTRRARRGRGRRSGAHWRCSPASRPRASCSRSCRRGRRRRGATCRTCRSPPSCAGAPRWPRGARWRSPTPARPTCARW
jgi:DNA-binding SARP family transcriptional activator/TolB-like protein